MVDCNKITRRQRPFPVFSLERVSNGYRRCIILSIKSVHVSDWRQIDRVCRNTKNSLASEYFYSFGRPPVSHLYFISILRQGTHLEFSDTMYEFQFRRIFSFLFFTPSSSVPSPIVIKIDSIFSFCPFYNLLRRISQLFSVVPFFFPFILLRSFHIFVVRSN